MIGLFARRTGYAHLDVIRLGYGDWRVLSVGIDGSEPPQVLGFIERLGRGRFEVLWMSVPLEWAYTDSFDAALAALSGSDSFVGVRRGSRDQFVETAPARQGGRVRRRQRTDA